ncbi:hypothetical protein AURDEDRAFT_178426 [Auricularia subglabra TFB-10046 SS5]|uniref:Uncharacterized protein n=1 Tax=Auricularia subglabra (strain TFB-10046 / SS5) TaxID=717982 RepID=J0D1P1_AURST|nr:hypothetical protein AURDEDRAFT_178426 [Auricularia subglabra TFB-10046 SS5]
MAKKTSQRSKKTKGKETWKPSRLPGRRISRAPPANSSPNVLHTISQRSSPDVVTADNQHFEYTASDDLSRLASPAAQATSSATRARDEGTQGLGGVPMLATTDRDERAPSPGLSLSITPSGKIDGRSHSFSVRSTERSSP